MYVKFLQSTHCIKKTLTVSCTLLCESGDRVKFDQSSFSAYLHAVMLRHHCSEYGKLGGVSALCGHIVPWMNLIFYAFLTAFFTRVNQQHLSVILGLL